MPTLLGEAGIVNVESLEEDQQQIDWRAVVRRLDLHAGFAKNSGAVSAQPPNQPSHGLTAAPVEFFVCYSRRDATMVERICASLEEQGITCWMDKVSIAGSAVWRRSVVDGIRRARGVIFFGSVNSYASEHVGKELTLASEQGKPILPVHLDDGQPSGEFEYLLAGIHWVRYDSQRHEADIRQIIQGLGRADARNAVSAIEAGAERKHFSKFAWVGGLAVVAGAILFLLGQSFRRWHPKSAANQSEVGRTHRPDTDQTWAPPKSSPMVVSQVWQTNIVMATPASAPPPSVVTQVIIYSPPEALRPPEGQSLAAATNPSPLPLVQPGPLAFLPTNRNLGPISTNPQASATGGKTNLGPNGTKPAFELGEVKVESTDAEHGKPKH